MSYIKALELAKRKHQGQFRKDGSDYITHPLVVAAQFPKMEYKIVAILHDVVEDTNTTIAELSLSFSEEICTAIKAITKNKDESYLNFILRVKNNKIATAVKLVDLKHNLSDLWQGNLKEKYLMAEYILRED